MYGGKDAYLHACRGSRGRGMLYCVLLRNRLYLPSVSAKSAHKCLSLGRCPGSAGVCQSMVDRQTPATRYFSASSFGYYILHYPVLIVTCYVLHTCFSLPAIWNYLIAFVVELGLTAVLYELLKRVPGLRYAVLGIRNSKR